MNLRFKIFFVSPTGPIIKTYNSSQKPVKERDTTYILQGELNDTYTQSGP